MKDKAITYEQAKAPEDSMVVCGAARFTVITERILRLEYDPEGIFEDRPSQVVLRRDLPTPAFTTFDDGKRLEIATKNYHFVYEYAAAPYFSPETVHAETLNNFTNFGGFWRFGEKTFGDPPRHLNLLGCTRTLDRADGPVELEFGFLDRSGRTWFSDTHTPVWENGALVSRRPGCEDVYFIACQHDYVETLQELFLMTGRPPMLPRWSLGNWWSRYWEYSEESYNALVDSFAARDIPFTVGILDMDWHVTKVDPRYGKGWTGYTWNRDLFPDPARFLDGVRKKGLRVGLNLHPASGIQAIEDAYEAAARRMGLDPETKKPVVFDFTDPSFRAVYFEELLHPQEAIGVDFWWIDWQQGRTSTVPGLDPLWLLNHYHDEDARRDGKRALILSRYAGPGSQRYPVGFSGDAVSTWKSLQFQPYFTATSVNALFPWWSHDIGGFTRGTHEPELYLRWVQFGVFSPFLRLHSSKDPFLDKDPASFGEETAKAVARFLRLRHRLIPYLYSEVQKQHRDLVPFLQPLYYRVADWEEGYEHPNEYFFGSQLLALPVTTPVESETGRAFVSAYLPKGLWTDVFTGRTLAGDRRITLCRKKDEMPVFARAGAIVPLSGDGGNSIANPRLLDVYVFPGAPGEYELLEDDGETEAFDRGDFFATRFAFNPDQKTFTVRGEGNAALVPAERRLRVLFRGFAPCEAQGEGVEECAYDPATHTLTVTLSPLAPASEVKLTLSSTEREGGEDLKERVFRLLQETKIPSPEKRRLYAVLDREKTPERVLAGIIALEPSRELLNCLTEELAR